MSESTIESILDEIIKKSGLDLIIFLQTNRFLKRELICVQCNTTMSLNKYTKNSDRFAWRCITRTCSKFKEYLSVRTGSFFSNINCSFKHAFKIICGYACRQQRLTIKRSVPISEPTITKIIKKLVGLIPPVDFSNDKMGGTGKVVQVDETMLNYKCKSHRGRSPLNRTDSLCIIEYEGRILRAFATVIPNKSQNTIVPIICSQVNSGSVVHTDEHGAYFNLRNFNFLHDTVCHKYCFVNKTTGAHTQGIESFHNELKLEIKKRKGVRTNERPNFLREFCFYFNNRQNFDDAILTIIKI